jgi:hypothetical protein
MLLGDMVCLTHKIYDRLDLTSANQPSNDRQIAVIHHEKTHLAPTGIPWLFLPQSGQTLRFLNLQFPALNVITCSDYGFRGRVSNHQLQEKTMVGNKEQQAKGVQKQVEGKTEKRLGDVKEVVKDAAKKG